jgi:hypothetical protein
MLHPDCHHAYLIRRIDRKEPGTDSAFDKKVGRHTLTVGQGKLRSAPCKFHSSDARQSA